MATAAEVSARKARASKIRSELRARQKAGDTSSVFRKATSTPYAGAETRTTASGGTVTVTGAGTVTERSASGALVERYQADRPAAKSYVKSQSQIMREYLARPSEKVDYETAQISKVTGKAPTTLAAQKLYWAKDYKEDTLRKAQEKALIEQRVSGQFVPQPLRYRSAAEVKEELAEQIMGADLFKVRHIPLPFTDKTMAIAEPQLFDPKAMEKARIILSIKKQEAEQQTGLPAQLKRLLYGAGTSYQRHIGVPVAKRPYVAIPLIVGGATLATLFPPLAVATGGGMLGWGAIETGYRIKKGETVMGALGETSIYWAPAAALGINKLIAGRKFKIPKPRWPWSKAPPPPKPPIGRVYTPAGAGKRLTEIKTTKGWISKPKLRAEVDIILNRPAGTWESMYGGKTPGLISRMFASKKGTYYGGRDMTIRTRDLTTVGRDLTIWKPSPKFTFIAPLGGLAAPIPKFDIVISKSGIMTIPKAKYGLTPIPWSKVKLPQIMQTKAIVKVSGGRSLRKVSKTPLMKIPKYPVMKIPKYPVMKIPKYPVMKVPKYPIMKTPGRALVPKEVYYPKAPSDYWSFKVPSIPTFAIPLIPIPFKIGLTKFPSWGKRYGGRRRTRAKYMHSVVGIALKIKTPKIKKWHLMGGMLTGFELRGI